MKVCMFQFTLLGLTGASLSAGPGMGSLANDAYQLRMSGKANQAEELLRQNLKADTANALAWFELARTKNHIFLGQGQFSQVSWNEVIDYASKSVRYDPGNEVYAYYYAYCRLLDAFISMMQGQGDSKEKASLACESFQSVLKVNPDCHAAELYIIDLLAVVPPEMGGDKTRAAAMADGMKLQDATCYAMAKARLLPDTADLVLYWQNVARDEGMNAQVMEELGRAFLFKSDTENGERYFKDAMKTDSSKRYLTMNLVRYHLMRAQQDPANKDSHLKSAADLANDYLLSDPEPVPPLKAFAYNTLAMISMFSGDQAARTKYGELATSIDPFCSKASGMPPDMLYCPPEKVKIQYSSFFMPF